MEELTEIPLDKFNITDYVIFSSNSAPIVMWRVLHTICCLFSCYFYIYLAAFGTNSLGDAGYNWDWAFQTIFIISMITEFVTAYKVHPGEPEIRDPIMIFNNYKNGNFLPDLIPLIPYHMIFEFNNGQEKLLLLVKLVRLYRGLSLFRAKNIKFYMKAFFKWKINRVLKDKNVANTKDVDYN